MFPEPIKKFVELFAALPGIGPRQAARLAFYIIKQGKNAVAEIIRTISDLNSIETCSVCFMAYENGNLRRRNIDGSTSNACHICSNPQRRKDIIAVVEKETDLISLEKTKKFDGRYLVLGELKRDGVLETPQKLRISSLKNFIAKELDGQAEEIILAINPTTYGDLNASMIAQELKPFAKKITRLGRGIPTGGEIEFADEDTLGSALDNRS